jgi:hypothetical protein
MSNSYYTFTKTQFNTCKIDNDQLLFNERKLKYNYYNYPKKLFFDKLRYCNNNYYYNTIKQNHRLNVNYLKVSHITNKKWNNNIFDNLNYSQLIMPKLWEIHIFNGIKSHYADMFNYNDDSASEGYSLFTLDYFNKNIYNKIVIHYRSNNTQKLWLNNLDGLLSENKDWIQDPVFVQKVNITDSRAEIALIGDIHSSIHSFIDVLKSLRTKDFFEGNTYKLFDDKYIIFLGDLLDRGPYSLEVLMLALILKIENPTKVFIINGNHEDYETYNHYGTTSEMNVQFKEISETIKKLLFHLPSAIFLNFCGKTYQLCHGAFDLEYGGLIVKKTIDDDYELNQIDSKSKLKIFLDSEKTFDLVEKYNVTNSLKWGDFDNNIKYYCPPDGRGDIYGYKGTKMYLSLNYLESIISGHQDNINLGILKDEECPEEHKKTYYKTSNHYNGISREKLYELIDTDKNVYNLSLSKDKLAFVTSTAAISKNLNNNCYLILKNM